MGTLNSFDLHLHPLGPGPAAESPRSMVLVSFSASVTGTPPGRRRGWLFGPVPEHAVRGARTGARRQAGIGRASGGISKVRPRAPREPGRARQLALPRLCLCTARAREAGGLRSLAPRAAFSVSVWPRNGASAEAQTGRAQRCALPVRLPSDKPCRHRLASYLAFSPRGREPPPSGAPAGPPVALAVESRRAWGGARRAPREWCSPKWGDLHAPVSSARAPLFLCAGLGLRAPRDDRREIASRDLVVSLMGRS